MNGRWILILFFVTPLALGVLLYQTLKNAPQIKSMVTGEMKKEFVDYAKVILKQDKILVKNAEKTYEIPISSDWIFKLEDKTLVIEPTQFIPTASTEIQAQIRPLAEKAISDLALTWLKDKFHTLKDVELKIEWP